MKTASVCIKHPKSDRVEQGMALLGTGAKQTYITVEKAKSMGLNVGPTQVLQLNTFGNTIPTEFTTSQTTFYIRQINGSYKRINARVCKNITGQLIKSKIPLEKYEDVWKDLTLADDVRDDGKIRHINRK